MSNKSGEMFSGYGVPRYFLQKNQISLARNEAFEVCVDGFLRLSSSSSTRAVFVLQPGGDLGQARWPGSMGLSKEECVVQEFRA